MSWLDFLKPKKDYPKFWDDYLDAFKNKQSEYFVAFDCETTGLNPKEDLILSIGAVKFSNERIPIKENKEWFLQQNHMKVESVKIHGILPSTSSESLLTEKEAILNFLNYIGGVTLVGHHIKFDVAMINHALKRLDAGKLKNKLIDTNDIYKSKGHYANEQNFSLDHLCSEFQISASNRHTALGDAYITAQVFQRLYVI